MAGVGLILLAIFLGLFLHKALNKPPFTRERPPLVPLPLQKRNAIGVYPPGNYLFDTVPDATSSSSSVTLKGFTMHLEGVIDSKVVDSSIPGDEDLPTQGISVLHISSQSQVAHGPSQNSLHRSISQLLDTHDKKSLMDDGLWDTMVHGYDSGMFMEDEVFVETIKGFSTVRKEHTMFTDTNL
ncbi:usherin [Brienomyrus brachyistius]|uniref:usherin n=1 Tax=Brienomyrus brachyistius TaxID=42636 RepID=UPI0020B409A1|nr:usherin [Brienomyrus brachyistius]